MPILLLIGFILIPMLEIAVFIEVGGWIGLWPTLGLIMLTALLGTWQLRTQGLATLERAKLQLDQGKMPAKELFNGACLLIAGVLLLVPGFVTDVIGGLLFIPALREALRRTIGRRFAESAETRVFVDGEEVHRSKARDGVIDAEFEEVPDEPPRKLPR